MSKVKILIPIGISREQLNNELAFADKYFVRRDEVGLNNHIETFFPDATIESSGIQHISGNVVHADAKGTPIEPGKYFEHSLEQPPPGISLGGFSEQTKKNAESELLRKMVYTIIVIMAIVGGVFCFMLKSISFDTYYQVSAIVLLFSIYMLSK